MVYRKKYLSESDFKKLYDFLKSEYITLQEKVTDWSLRYKRSPEYDHQLWNGNQFETLKRLQTFLKKLGLDENKGTLYGGTLFAKISDRYERVPTYKEFHEWAEKLGFFDPDITFEKMRKALDDEFDDEYNHVDLSYLKMAEKFYGNFNTRKRLNSN